MIDLLLDACAEAGVDRPLVVLNPAQRAVAEHVQGRCDVVWQAAPRGTGHALSMVPPERLRGDILVLNGDCPLVRGETLKRLYATHRSAGAATTIASVVVPGRHDGRVMRDGQGRFHRIVEEKDASAAEREITEINAGLYCFRAEGLAEELARLRPDNRQGEYYITDLVARHTPVEVVRLEDPDEALGVNDRVQLAAAERALRSRIVRDLMLGGVTFTDPASCLVEVGVKIGGDTVVEPFTILRGKTVIGEDCRIGPYADIADSEVGNACVVDHAWLRECRLGDRSDCGPFVKLRPGTEVADDVHIGSFGEIVRSRIGTRSRVPHFAYVGDAVIGENVNIGAGTVTANYDGTAKNQTVIEDDAFVGVDTLLRAPVKLGRGSKTGAGSVVLSDVPPGVTVVGAPARAIPRKIGRKR